MRHLASLAGRVGEIVAAPMPVQSGFLDSLEKLLENPKTISRLARLTRDSRLSREAYEAVLLREFAQLVLWARQRALFACLYPASSRRRTRSNRALCLLPRDAPVAHILRRAVPFAAIGLETRVCFPESDMLSRNATAVDVVARVLDLRDALRIGERGARSEFKEHSRRTDLVVATGRRPTLAALQAGSRAPFFGAAGRCAILLGDSATALRHAYRRASLANVARSCSRVRAAFVVNTNGVRPRFVSPWAARDSAGHEMSALDRLHPSAIYWIGGQRRHETLDRRLGDFAVFHTDGALRVRNAAGFGKDPVFGWPGDYRV